MQNKFIIVLDYDTASVRALIVNTQTGESIGTAVHYYKRWRKWLFYNPSTSQFRQYQLDYLEGLEEAIKGAFEGFSHFYLR